MPKLAVFVLSLLLSSALTAIAGEGEDTIEFKNSPYPINIDFSAENTIGARIFESGLSETPPYSYDTVLIQGEMPDPGLRIEILIRSKNQPKDFYKSQELETRRFPNGRFWAKYSVGQQTRQPVKLSVINLGLKSSGKLIIYEVELLKAAQLKEIKEAVSAAAGMPDVSLSLPDTFPFKITRRAGWRALPPKEAYTAQTPAMFTLHHTAGHYPKNYNEAVAEMQFIQDYHQNARGWIDIGYHFQISPQGDIFEGRPIGVVGAHVLNHNTGNVGISIMGNYHPPASMPITPEIVSSLTAIGSYMKDAYSVSVSSFYAHRDLGPTDCPGDSLYARMPEFKSLIFTPVPDAPAGSKALNRIIDSLKVPEEVKFQ